MRKSRFSEAQIIGMIKEQEAGMPTADDARKKLALWRYDYNQVRPHSSLDNQTPAAARRALEQFEGSAHAALAQTDDEEYEIQTRKLSL